MKARVDGSGKIITGDGKISVTGNHIEWTCKDEMPSCSWEQQLDRTERNFNRAKQVCAGSVKSNGIGSIPDPDECLDQIFNFYLNCYHLKDWLINDKNFPADKKQVEKYINQNWELKLCADLCNGQKHFVLKRPRSGDEPKVAERKLRSRLETSPTCSISQHIGYTINTKFGSMDALDLAAKCLNLWKTFVNNKKSSPNE